MDYKRIRETLRQIRFERKMGVPELAEEAGISKSTLYRLEDLDDEPERTIDLGTLEKLTKALDLTFSGFFARIEVSTTQPLLGDNLPSLKPNPVAEAARGGSFIPGGGVPSNGFVNEAIIIDIAETLAEAFIQAIDRLAQSRRQTATPRAHKAVRHAGRRKTG